jgi:hypothetical protein
MAWSSYPADAAIGSESDFAISGLTPSIELSLENPSLV